MMTREQGPVWLGVRLTSQAYLAIVAKISNAKRVPLKARGQHGQSDQPCPGQGTRQLSLSLSGLGR